MARFRMLAGFMSSLYEKEEDDSSMFSDGGFVLEEFQSEESGAESSDTLDEPRYRAGNKRKAAEGEEAAVIFASPPSPPLPTKSKNNLKKRVGRKAAWSDECIDEVVDIICDSDYYRKKLIQNRILCSA